MENPGINLFEVGLDLLGNGMGASGGVGVEGDVVVELGFVGVELGELGVVYAEFDLFFGGGVDVGIHCVYFVIERPLHKYE